LDLSFALGQMDWLPIRSFGSRQNGVNRDGRCIGKDVCRQDDAAEKRIETDEAGDGKAGSEDHGTGSEESKAVVWQELTPVA
jgi:hypothetical protein